MRMTPSSPGPPITAASGGDIARPGGDRADRPGPEPPRLVTDRAGGSTHRCDEPDVIDLDATDAFATMYRDHWGQIVSFLRRRVPEHVAEDLAQDVFAAVWKVDGCDARLGPRRAYLYGIAKHKAVDWQRRQAAKDARERRAAAQPTFDIGLDDLACGLDDAARLSAALRSLADSQRQAIQLAFFGGLTHPEVASAVGAPLGTVKTRIRDGLLRLRVELRDLQI